MRSRTPLAPPQRSAHDPRVRSDLPSGTVTFLFTDVEGSTGLLHELGAEDYAEALAEHRRIIREACAAERGVEVDTQGDAFFFAFPTAPGALAAAAAVTESLAPGPIHVRVGLHTGTPLIGDEGYVGHDVHRAARIASAGHGGQVLLSASTAPLVEAELVDLGQHRLKDLRAPERLYQLGDGAFEPLRSLYRTTLPMPPTAFVGRTRELIEVTRLLERKDARLITLTGPGGTGKTRLLMQAAAEVSESFPDGVWWVPLAPLRSPALIETGFAQALQVVARPGMAIADALVSAFADRRALVVVDNCEHLVEGVAALVRKLLDGSPRLVVSGSSRVRLGLSGERIYAVPPMVASDSGRLFFERASGVSPDFTVDEHVTAICEAVDQLPLAIELAAARTRTLSTKAIRERLADRLALLATRDRDVEARQRTLEATIAWSYELLDPDERRALRALAVFSGGCTLESASEVADVDLDMLEALFDKSLLRHRIDAAGQDRYWMLETIREFATERLDESSEAQELRERHAGWVTGRALHLGPQLEFEAGAFHAVQDELPNIRQALTWYSNAPEKYEALASAVWRLWTTIRHAREGKEIFAQTLESYLGDAVRARDLRSASWIAYYLGEYETAVVMADERLEIASAAEDTEGIGGALSLKAFVALELEDVARAKALLEECIRIAEQAGQNVNLVRHLMGLGDVLVGAGEYEAAVRRLEQAREIAPPGFLRASVLSTLGCAYVGVGDFERARSALSEAIDFNRAADGGIEVTLTLQKLAVVLASSHRSEAARLLAFSDTHLEVTDLVQGPWWTVLRDRTVRTIETGVSASELRAALAAGRTMSLDEAVELGLSVGTDN
jgi:predicted ATPase/class 3 adenylate cyclase